MSRPDYGTACYFNCEKNLQKAMEKRAFADEKTMMLYFERRERTTLLDRFACLCGSGQNPGILRRRGCRLKRIGFADGKNVRKSQRLLRKGRVCEVYVRCDLRSRPIIDSIITTLPTKEEKTD